MADRSTSHATDLTAATPAPNAPNVRRGLAAAFGAVVAAGLASLCCAGPLVFVAFGVGAGLASTFEPLRPTTVTDDALDALDALRYARGDAMTTKLPYAALGVGAAGLLSICDLCKTPAEAATVQAGTTRSFPASAIPAPARKTVTLDVRGMTCSGCVVGVRTVLARLPGVAKADVRYETHRAVVSYDPTRVTVAQMIAAIRTLRYTATAVAD